jgi:hypothetical protein
VAVVVVLLVQQMAFLVVRAVVVAVVQVQALQVQVRQVKVLQVVVALTQMLVAVAVVLPP